MKTFALAAVAVLAIASVTGCSSSSSEEEPVVAEGALATQGAAIEGTFETEFEGKKVQFDYSLKSDIGARTAVWNAKVAKNPEHANVWDDVDEAGRITNVTGCEQQPQRVTRGGASGGAAACSFTAEVKAKDNGRLLAVIMVANGKATSIKYENKATKLIDEGAAGGTTSADSPDDLGACTLNGGSCKEIKRSECKAGPLFPQLRCCMNFEFKAGETCGR